MGILCAHLLDRDRTVFSVLIVTLPRQEDALAELMKKGAASGAIASMFSKGSKWGGLDIKRVYFGYAPHLPHSAQSSHHGFLRNWLRDYSQVRFHRIYASSPRF